MYRYTYIDIYIYISHAAVLSNHISEKRGSATPLKKKHCHFRSNSCQKSSPLITSHSGLLPFLWSQAWFCGWKIV